MTSIYDAPIPEARWAVPVDSEWDIHYNEFEFWVNEHYDKADQSILGHRIPWDEECESDDLFDIFMDELNRSKEI